MRGLVLPFFLVSLCGLRTSAAQSADAESLFVRGDFAAARTAFERRLASNRSDAPARIRLGLLALWENRLDAAEAHLTAAHTADSANREVRNALAEVRYRQRRWAEAAQLNRGLGRGAMADKLADISAPLVATIEPARGARVPFAPGAVLPVLAAQVNGHAATLLLDTGAGETILDTAFARTIGARRYGVDSAVFAGGRRATYEHGSVDSLVVGGARLRGVPVLIQATSQYAPAAGGRRVDGIIGTGFLAQFRSTIDFGGSALVLAPRAPTPPSGAVVLPIWLLGDHFITLRAEAAGIPTLLVFDTGLAMPGGAFVPSEGIVKRSGAQVGSAAVSGIGGGGAVRVTPFQFQKLAIGPIERTDVLSLAGAFPAVLERRFGAEIGGLVSHGFFADRAVTLDFDAMRMIVEPSSAAPPSRAPAEAGPSANLPAPAVPQALSDDSVVARARAIVTLLRDKGYDRLSPYWSARLNAQVPPAQVGTTWDGLILAVGAPTEIQTPVLSSGTTGRQVKVPVKFARATIAVTLTFDGEGRVIGLAMQPT
ncbi:MAG: DUF3887 domain-containing protein [Gemmatimonadales bacterium]|nr:DUF3887 domain-containing protein [Gemmatimonadales bacterium]